MAERKLCAGCLRGDEENTGEAWCCECNELVCKTCSTFHQKLSPSHKVVLTKNLASISSSLMTLSRNCEIHNDQRLILFCCQHDQLICSSCLPESHQNCKPIMSIEMAAKDVHRGTTLSNLETRMDNLTQVMEKILTLYCTQISSFDNKTKEFKGIVADIKRNIISHLDNLEADFNKEVDIKWNECSKTLTKNKIDIQGRYDTLTTWRKDMRSLKQQTSNVQLFNVIKYLDAKTHREETEIRNFKTDTKIPTLNFHPAKQMLKICDKIPSFGELSVDNTPIPTAIDLDIDQQGQAFVRSEVPKGPVPLIKSFETSKLGDGVGILNACFLPDNKLLLCANEREKVYFCDHDGSNARTINLDYEPRDVTLYDRDTALVTVGDKGIQIIDLKTLKPGKRIKVGSNCYGITSLNVKIWVKSDIYTLTMIDIKGKVQEKVTTAFVPYGICLSKDGDIYYTDSVREDIYVVTSDGKERVVYSSHDLRSTLGITVDDHGDVYAAGYWSHNIHRISSDGKQSKIILTEHDGIKDPIGLSYNHQTKELMVVNNFGKSINIYKVR